MTVRRFLPGLVLWLFPLVAIALVAGVAVAVIVVSETYFDGDWIGVLLRILVAPLVIAVVLGVWAAVTYKPQPAEGIEVTAAEHPHLWADVASLASLAQTEPPHRIVIDFEVNASVREVAGQRELILGLPLIATLTRGQLRAVLAHELGHFAGGDTAANAKILRRALLLERVRAEVGILWRWFFTAYALAYAAVAGPASRTAELRADQLSIQAAGPRTAAEAMRAVVRTGLADDHLNADYFPLCEAAGVRASTRDGLRQLLSANADEIEKATRQIIADEKPSLFTTHPPLRERMARCEDAARAGAPDPAPGTDADAPAYDLLGGGAAWLDAAENELLVHPLPLATWDDVIVRGTRQEVNAQAEQIEAWARSEGLGERGLNTLLALIDDTNDGGIVARLTDEKPGSDEGVDAVVDLLFSPVLAAMLACGTARVQPSWTGPVRFVTADGTDLDLAARLANCIRHGDSSAIRDWLTDAGVDVTSAHATADLPHWMAAASHMTGPWQGRRDVHFWSTGILALPPLDKATVKEDKDEVADEHQHPRLYYARAEGLQAGRRAPGSLWWDAAQIVGADIGGAMKLRLTLTLAEGDTLAMKGTLDTACVDTVEDVGVAIRYLATPKG
ncbi:MAG: M48 family metallopeptidase [Propioniciclava sp.]|uniref:M48 family metallopeptidase n=1 Tax=Propioniciclava sp. TaxID=2038686 RepID=UPI0039E34130